MSMNRRQFVGAAASATAGLIVASCASAPKQALLPPVPAAPVAAAPQPAHVFDTTGRPLVAEALAALDRHAGVISRRDRMAVADFTLPSSQARFHLVNLENGRIEASWLVAHGRGSDPAGTGMLQRFSNEPGSFATSRGAYVTADQYAGKYGTAQRLVGLDADNNMAFDREIVIHGAPYVDPRLIASQGRIGRSEGCFAFELGEVARVMELLGPGRMIYASKA